MAEIGYKPADITYMALSHYHYDHSANANAFAGSTWLVNGPSATQCFRTRRRQTDHPNVSDKFSALKTQDHVLDGDHDVFGDGSVVILATPGHTPGHQSLFVKLAKTGPLVLAAIYITILPSGRSRTSCRSAAAATTPRRRPRRPRSKSVLKDKRATLWIQHDIVADAKLKKSPAYYD